MINKPKEVSYNPDMDFVAEPKLDGMRAIIRSHGFDEFELLHDDTSKKIQFPEIIPQFQEGTEIDGEICIPIDKWSADWESFQKRIAVQNTQLINHYAKTIPVKFVAFDILKYKGKDLTDQPLKERRSLLSALILNTPQQNIDIIPQGNPDLMWKQVINKNGEGIVVKKRNGKYDDLWIKQKNWKEKDFIVSGVEEKKVNWVLNLQDEDRKDVGNVTMTGYDRTPELKKTIIGMTAVIKYLGFGNKLRIPILKELRT
jgi:DNA ligase-1